MSFYVVAGVTGHVGSGAADRLLADGRRVRVIVRDAARGAKWAHRGAELAVGSLGDAGFLARALEGAVGAFVLLPGTAMDPAYPDSLLPLADAIAEGVKAGRVPHVVALSSLGADLERGTGPVRVLHHFEQVLAATGTRLTAVRASWFQENLGAVLPAARAGGIFPSMMPSADFAFPRIATRDIGPVAAKTLLVKPVRNEVVDVVGPSHSDREIAGVLGRLLGMDLRVFEVPAAAQAATLVQAGIPPSGAKALAELNAAIGAELLVPRGDRRVDGTTPVEETLRAILHQ